MVFQFLSRFAGYGLVIITFIRLIQNTAFERFLKWVPLLNYFIIPFLDFVFKNYYFIAPILLVLVLSRWIKDWRVLAVFGILFGLFLKFLII